MNQDYKERLAKFPKIPKDPFPFDEAVRSRYIYHRCIICGSHGFIEYLTEINLHKTLCPRCGRYIIGSSVIHAVIDTNLNNIASCIFSYLLKIKNNEYYANNSKVQFLCDTEDIVKYEKKIDNTMFEIVDVTIIEKECGDLDNMNVLLEKIVENIGLCLIEETNYFFIGDSIDVLTHTVFFLGQRSKSENNIALLNKRIGYLIEQGYIFLEKEDDEGKCYTLSLKGWQTMKGFNKKENDDKTTLKVEGNYIDMKGAIISDSNIGDSGTIINELVSKEKGSFWIGVWQSIVSSIFTKIIVGIIVIILIALGIVNWDNIVEMIMGG